MKLLEATEAIESLNQEETLYVKLPWTPESEVALRIEDEDATVSTPLDLKEKGYEYFLEVYLTKEFKEDLLETGKYNTEIDICNRIIQYAINDA
ncbi:hypothetical protein [Endozoicomonas elysicola]|uniref:hypothetical protein n=1 Tax=Endozoicomonas elysicola TaxID=305900 RepID=UPI00036ADF4B|nr:hypothetical protein [Endozoicomonas elysicola]